MEVASESKTKITVSKRYYEESVKEFDWLKKQMEEYQERLKLVSELIMKMGKEHGFENLPPRPEDLLEKEEERWNCGKCDKYFYTFEAMRKHLIKDHGHRP